MHFNLYFNEQEDHHPSGIHEGIHPNFIYEEYNEHVENYVSDIFKKHFSMPIYDDDYLNNAPEEQNDIPFEIHERNQVINSEILNEFVNTSF